MNTMPISPDDIPTRIELSYVSRISPLTGNTIRLGEDDAAAVIAHHWPAIEQHIREQIALEIEAEAAKTADENTDFGLYLGARIARSGTKES